MRVLCITHHESAGPGVFGDPPWGELSVWMPPSGQPPPALEEFDAAMVFGGEMQVDEEHLHPWLRGEKELIRGLFERGTPLLGVCLGCQLVAEAAGARPHRAAAPEVGWHRVEVTDEGRADPLIGPLSPSFEVFQWHSYEAPLPPGGVALARNPAHLQAFRVVGRPAWGIQFHAEVTGPDLQSWLADWDDDPAALSTGLNADTIRSESERRIAAQNELGRRLATRFLEQAQAAAGHPAPARPSAP